MNTTFISRGKAMLGAAIATIALAFGMAALAPANAQAIDIDDSGVDYVTLTVDGPSATFHGLSWKVVSKWVDEVSDDPEDEIIGTWQLDFCVDSLRYTAYASPCCDSYEKAEIGAMLKGSKIQMMDIGECSFWRFAQSDNEWANFEITLHALLLPESNWFLDECEYGANRLPYAVKFTNDNVVYTLHRADYMFKSGYRDFKYKYTFTPELNYGVVRFNASSKYSVPTSTTKWRTLAKTKTAYKSSTSTKKKFSCAKGSKVQVKKIYWNKSTGKLRYYVKNKKGKYGWIAGTTYSAGA